MNITEHLLTCLSEECQEVAKECSKALRFGLEDQVTLDPTGPRGTQGPTNQEKLVDELNDLMGTIQKLVQRGVIPANWSNPFKQQAKGSRIEMYMSYACRVGSLHVENSVLNQ